MWPKMWMSVCYVNILMQSWCFCNFQASLFQKYTWFGPLSLQFPVVWRYVNKYKHWIMVILCIIFKIITCKMCFSLNFEAKIGVFAIFRDLYFENILDLAPFFYNFFLYGDLLTDTNIENGDIVKSFQNN